MLCTQDYNIKFTKWTISLFGLNLIYVATHVQTSHQTQNLPFLVTWPKRVSPVTVPMAKSAVDRRAVRAVTGRAETRQSATDGPSSADLNRSRVTQVTGWLPGGMKAGPGVGYDVRTSAIPGIGKTGISWHWKRFGYWRLDEEWSRCGWRRFEDLWMTKEVWRKVPS